VLRLAGRRPVGSTLEIRRNSKYNAVDCPVTVVAGDTCRRPTISISNCGGETLKNGSENEKKVKWMKGFTHGDPRAGRPLTLLEH